MVRMLSFAFAALLLSAGIVGAQGPVLVPHPPSYADGEYYAGFGSFPNGVTFNIHQLAQRSATGNMYVQVDFEVGGEIFTRGIFDPRTWQTVIVSPGETSVLESTTCSPETLYPIFLGKVYECESLLNVNGRLVRTRDRMEFDRSYRDERGGLIGFGARYYSDDGRSAMCADVRHSPDGKWTQEVRFLDCSAL